MIHIENTAVSGWEAAIRGMRNPLNSWERSDTTYNTCSDTPNIGPNDMKLMQNLCKAGSEHRKFLRYLTVTFDITAPIVFFQQLDTYKIGTVRNSTSKMHKLLHKEFDESDFACEELPDEAKGVLLVVIDTLNCWRKRYLALPDEKVMEKKALWESILRILPESYCQKSTMLVNYEVLRSIYRQRKGHKLKEWASLLNWIESLPYADKLIIGEECYES